MAGQGSVNIKNQTTSLSRTRPNTSIYVADSIQKLLAKRRDPEQVQDLSELDENETIKTPISDKWDWTEITKNTNAASTCTLQYKLQKTDGVQDNLYSADPLKNLGINIDKQSGQKKYVLILEEENLDKTLFLGYFTSASINHDNQTCTVKVTGVESLLDEKKIIGSIQKVATNAFDYVIGTKTIFNKNVGNNRTTSVKSTPANSALGYVNFEEVYLDETFTQSGDYLGSVAQMIRYVELMFTKMTNNPYYTDNLLDLPQTIGIIGAGGDQIGVLKQNDEDNSNYPIFNFNILQSLKALLSDNEYAARFGNNFPRDIDISGMTVRKALESLLALGGAFSLAFTIGKCKAKIKNDSSEKLPKNMITVEAVCSEPQFTKTVNTNINWGSFGSDVKRDYNVESVDLDFERESKVKKIVAFGGRTRVQMNAFYNGNSSTPLSPDIELATGQNVNNVWLSDTYATIRLVKRGYRDYHFKIDPNVNGVLGSALCNDFFKTTVGSNIAVLPPISNASDRLLETELLAPEDSSTDSIASVYLYQNDTWYDAAQLGFTIQFNDDLSGFVFLDVLDNTKEKLDDILDSGNPWMVAVINLVTDHRIRKVAGLDEDGEITTNEEDIAPINNDEEILYLTLPEYYNAVYWEHYKLIDGEWKEYHLRTDKKAIGENLGTETSTTNEQKKIVNKEAVLEKYVENQMKRHYVANNVGQITVTGWTSLQCGQYIKTIEGTGRTLQLKSVVDSITLNRDWSSTISFSRPSYSPPPRNPFGLLNFEPSAVRSYATMINELSQ